jgi:hypothetical protein
MAMGMGFHKMANNNNKTVNIWRSIALLRRKGVCVSMLDMHIHIRPQALPRNKSHR